MKIVVLIQVFNAVMGYFMWLAYGYQISIWIIAALSVFSTISFFVVKTAQERQGITF
jgi:hypothetical protein